MIDASNDADLLTLELTEAANMAANGVCSICEEALDPIAFKAKHPESYDSPRYTAEMAAECVGPVHPHLPFHIDCLEQEGLT